MTPSKQLQLGKRRSRKLTLRHAQTVCIANTNVGVCSISDRSLEPDESSSMNHPVDENAFHSAPSHLAPADQPAEGSYQEASAEDLLPCPDFKPFFTVVEDPDTGEHHHPTVHYVFSDDDPEILTNSMLDVLDQPSTSQPSIPERVALLDMAADGKLVASTLSLSSQWQSLQASVSQAPSWGESAPGAERGLMLKLSGQEFVKTTVEKDKQSPQVSLEDLMKSFSERLTGLDEIVGDREQTMAHEQAL